MEFDRAFADFDLPSGGGETLPGLQPERSPADEFAELGLAPAAPPCAALLAVALDYENLGLIRQVFCELFSAGDQEQLISVAELLQARAPQFSASCNSLAEAAARFFLDLAINYGQLHVLEWAHHHTAWVSIGTLVRCRRHCEAWALSTLVGQPPPAAPVRMTDPIWAVIWDGVIGGY